MLVAVRLVDALVHLVALLAVLRVGLLLLVLVALVLGLAGCATGRQVVVPEEVKVVVVTYAPIPQSLTEECYVAPKRDNTVGEALRVAKDRGVCNDKDRADKRAIRKISNTAVGL